jgi:hypothetical protein
MARTYEAMVANIQPVVAMLSSQIYLPSYTTIRLTISEVQISARIDGAGQTVFDLERQVNAITSGGSSASPAVTLGAQDGSDPASAITLTSAITSALSGVTTAMVGLTVGEIVHHFGCNQRSSYRYITQPGAEWKYPAVAQKGAVLECKAQTPGYVIESTLVYQE